MARRIAADGHLIGNHSFYHARMPLLSPEGFEEDVREAQRAIVEATGVDPRPWLRFPFGAGADAAALVGRLRRPAIATSDGTSRSTSGSPAGPPARSRPRPSTG